MCISMNEGRLPETPCCLIWTAVARLYKEKEPGSLEELIFYFVLVSKISASYLTKINVDY